jgi:uncharacterized protein (DUF2236 family)
VADGRSHAPPLIALDAPSPGQISKRINGERCVLFGWSRAILMQLAHPLIAAGVADHSTFRSGPLMAAARLHHTVRTMLALTFGDADRQQQAIATIATIHARVHGELRETAGHFPAGTRYSAEDPALVLWVYVTLIDSVLIAYELLVAPLAEAERDAYCNEAAPVAVALGADPARVPRDAVGVRACVATTLETGTLAVTADATALVDAVLRPPLAWLAGPAAAMNRRITIGLLPSQLRSAYGFTWTPEEARRCDRLMRRIRRLRAVMPDRIALWPEARRPVFPAIL